MAIKTLEKDTRCALCGGMMKAGSAFRWHEKSARHVANGSRGIPARWRPAHASASDCERETRGHLIEAEKAQAARVEAAMAAAKAGQSSEQVLAILLLS